MPSKAAVMTLLAGRAPKSDTARMTRWLLEGDAVSHFLGCEQLCHPVAFDGKIFCIDGSKPPKAACSLLSSMRQKEISLGGTSAGMITGVNTQLRFPCLLRLKFRLNMTASSFR